MISQLSSLLYVFAGKLCVICEIFFGNCPSPEELAEFHF